MILAIETSDELCSLAFVDGERTILEFNMEWPRQHARLVGEMLDSGLLRISELKNTHEDSAEQISLVTVALGPGSFTGLRIGMSLAKGFCYARNVPIVGISNHQVLAAQHAAERKPVYSIIEARRGEIYLARHEIMDGQYSVVEEQKIIAKEQLAGNLADASQVVYNRSLELPDKVLDALAEKDIVRVQNAIYSAALTGRLGRHKFEREGADNLSELEPLYIRAFAGVV